MSMNDSRVNPKATRASFQTWVSSGPRWRRQCSASCTSLTRASSPRRAPVGRGGGRPAEGAPRVVPGLGRVGAAVAQAVQCLVHLLDAGVVDAVGVGGQVGEQAAHGRGSPGGVVGRRGGGGGRGRWTGRGAARAGGGFCGGGRVPAEGRRQGQARTPARVLRVALR